MIRVGVVSEYGDDGSSNSTTKPSICCNSSWIVRRYSLTCGDSLSLLLIGRSIGRPHLSSLWMFAITSTSRVIVVVVIIYLYPIPNIYRRILRCAYLPAPGLDNT